VTISSALPKGSLERVRTPPQEILAKLPRHFNPVAELLIFTNVETLIRGCVLSSCKATLEDISKGGMMITMPDPVELNNSIKVQLDGPNDAYNLSLRARVVRQETIIMSDFEMYQVAVEFEHPTKELRSMVQGLIHGLMHKEDLPARF